MVVFDLLAGALLHVRRGDDAEIDEGGMRSFVCFPSDPAHERGNVVAVTFEGTGDDDLRRPSRPVIRDEFANEGVTPL